MIHMQEKKENIMKVLKILMILCLITGLIVTSVVVSVNAKNDNSLKRITRGMLGNNNTTEIVNITKR